MADDETKPEGNDTPNDAEFVADNAVSEGASTAAVTPNPEESDTELVSPDEALESDELSEALSATDDDAPAAASEENGASEATPSDGAVEEATDEVQTDATAATASADENTEATADLADSDGAPLNLTRNWWKLTFPSRATTT